MGVRGGRRGREAKSLSGSPRGHYGFPRRIEWRWDGTPNKSGLELLRLEGCEARGLCGSNVSFLLVVRG